MRGRRLQAVRPLCGAQARHDGRVQVLLRQRGMAHDPRQRHRAGAASLCRRRHPGRRREDPGRLP